MGIFRQWLRPPAADSSSVARDRLRLVLVHNRLALSPDAVQNLKRDMLAVLARYFDIDQDSFELDVQRGKNSNQVVTSVAVKTKRARRHKQT